MTLSMLRIISVSFKYADTGSKRKAEYQSSIMNENQVVELSN